MVTGKCMSAIKKKNYYPMNENIEQGKEEKRLHKTMNVYAFPVSIFFFSQKREHFSKQDSNIKITWMFILIGSINRARKDTEM
jgi:hypothetical protein